MSLSPLSNALPRNTHLLHVPLAVFQFPDNEVHHEHRYFFDHFRSSPDGRQTTLKNGVSFIGSALLPLLSSAGSPSINDHPTEKLSQQTSQSREHLMECRARLNSMRSPSTDGPLSQQHQPDLSLLSRITQCCQLFDFASVTGESRHFARYSSDPLLGIASYPLCLHVLVLGATEIPVRLWMRRHGFEHYTVRRVSYYYHPGKGATCDSSQTSDRRKTPILFVHGIGLGLITYLRLVEQLLDTGRAILLPELPFVSGFRPWLSPSAPLSPHEVASTGTALLARHGFVKATWVGHSYGTTWLSYAAQLAPHTVAALLFLDPVCFAVHVPTLTRHFVYTRRDPGTSTYMVRTDVMVNWTIQRCFPWARISLFVEQLHNIPFGVFLADCDALIPSAQVEAYFQRHGVQVRDFVVGDGGALRPGDGPVPCSADRVKAAPFCYVFRGLGHGDWTEEPTSTLTTLAGAVEALCVQVD